MLEGNGICAADSGRAAGAEPGRALGAGSNLGFQSERRVKKGDVAHETFKNKERFFAVFWWIFIMQGEHKHYSWGREEEERNRYTSLFSSLKK